MAAGIMTNPEYLKPGSVDNVVQPPGLAKRVGPDAEHLRGQVSGKSALVLSGLFMGGRPSCSLGRVAFWVVFGLSIYFWITQPVEAFPPTLEQTLMFLLAYNLGGKLINKFDAGQNLNR